MGSTLDQQNMIHQLSPIQQIHQWNETACNLYYLDPQSGLRNAIKAYEMSIGNIVPQSPYQQGLADSLLNLSHYNSLLGNFALAINQAEEGLSLYQKLKQELPQAELYAQLGHIHAILDQRYYAIDYLMRGLEITQKNHYELTEGKLNLYIGAVYLGMGKFAQGLQTVFQAQRVFQNFKQADYHAMSLIMLAVAHTKLHQLEPAFENIHESLQIAESIDSPVLRAEGLCHLGMLHCLNQELNQAKTHFQAAQLLSKKNHLPYLMLRVKLGLSDIYILNKDYEQAQLLLKKCLKTAQEIKVDNLLLDVHHKLSMVYENLKQYNLSLTHFKQYSALTQQLFTEQSLQKVQAIEVLYRTRTASREIELTRQKNQALESEIQQRKTVEAELRKSEKRYRVLASFDPLTNLYNRRHFFNLAEIEFERAVRYQHPLAVLLIDLDHFKLVNDRYGHLVGDDLLAFVAALCKRSLRKIDIIGRYGGEEFIILLPATGGDQAVQLAERLCSTIQISKMPSIQGEIGVTASIGIGIHNSSSGNLESLLDDADQAMYMAKRRGRNQICLAPMRELDETDNAQAGKF
jgi:diguanylate cyclase (GGDEF)-like protein